jgi:hypothetical protein
VPERTAHRVVRDAEHHRHFPGSVAEDICPPEVTPWWQRR